MAASDTHADVRESPLAEWLELHSHAHTHWNSEALSDPSADRRPSCLGDTRVVSHAHIHVHFSGARENGMRFLGEWHNALNAHDGSHVHEPGSYAREEAEEGRTPEPEIVTSLREREKEKAPSRG